jgi:hypothetical protein
VVRRRGDPLARARGCDPPPGYVASHDDCDDDDPAVHPGADDPWYDGVDSDCDGANDHDADGDGYPWEGSAGATEPVDCDDDDPAIHPGALDWPDGVDDDCDGVVDVSDLTWIGARVRGSVDGAELGASLATLPDQDGDGRDDLLLGSPGIGAAWIVPGPLEQGATLPRVAIARLQGASLDSRAGDAVALAGDCDGDGVDDLAVGAWLDQGGRGSVTLLAGPVTDDTALEDADWRVLSSTQGDYLGYALAGVGDSDGDGFDDLLVGARGWSQAGADAGAAFLLPGGAGGPQGLDEAAEILGDAPRDFAGSAVAGPGDLDGDGLNDLVVGARGEDSGGGAFVFLGPVRGTRSIGDAEGCLRGEAPYDYAGWSLTGPGDLDGDGYAELAVGAYGRDDRLSAVGAVYLVHGRGAEAWQSLSSLSQANASYGGSIAREQAGWSLAGPGDVDGDGQRDLLVGAPGGDLGADGSGTVYLLLELDTGAHDLRDAALRLRGGAGTSAGAALAPTGDHDGDGLNDLLLGAPLDGEEGAAMVMGIGPGG